ISPSCRCAALLRSTIEGRPHLNPFHGSPTYDNVQRFAHTSLFAGYQSQPDILSKCRRVRPTRHMTDLPTVDLHRIVRSRRATPFGRPESDELSRWPRRLHRRDCVAADKVPLFELDSPAETRFERTDIIRQLLPV